MGDSSLESWVHRILRIPPEPKIPQGSSGSTQVFRAGKNYYWWRLFIWFIGHFFVGIGLFALYGILSRPLMHAPYWVAAIVHFLEAFALAVFLFSAFVNYYSQRLNYRLRWYIITDRSLRIRKGVIGVEELTMTFSNIQEIRIKAGPLQNLLRIADVEVHSAGGATGEPGGSGHMGRFEGVSNASEIRDFLVERLRQYRDSGLGDHSAVIGTPPAEETLVAARAVLAEAQALRAYFGGRG